MYFHRTLLYENNILDNKKSKRYIRQREDMYTHTYTQHTHISGERIFEAAQKNRCFFFSAVETVVISCRKILSTREIATFFIYEKFCSVLSSELSPNRILLIGID